MFQADRGTYIQLLEVLQKSDKADTQTQKDVSDFITQFELRERCSVLYFLEAALTAPELHMRQMAAICLKRAINLKWASLDNDVKMQLKNGLVRGIQLNDSEVRTMFGSAFVALFSVEGYERWPDAPGLLLTLLAESPNEIVRQTAGSTLVMLVEDMAASNYRDSAKPMGEAAWAHFMTFVTNQLVPRILELASTIPSSLPFFCKMLCALIDTGCFNTVIFETHFPAFWSLMGSIAQHQDPWVRKCVLKGMTETWNRRPLAILDSSAAVFAFVICSTNDTADNTVQLEALQFWAQLLKSRLEESVNSRLISQLRTHLPQLIPVLIEHTRYSSWDYMSMDESHFEEDNAGVPDRVEDVPPRPEGEMTADEDEESATWGNNWTPRKGAALALDYISQVYGQDNEIVQFLLEHIEKRLANDSDWEMKESAVLVLGAIASGCMLAMAPYLPKVVEYLIELTRHPKPLMRSIACWCLARYAGWACQVQHENPNENWLYRVLTAVLARVLDRSKRVQEAACSALASFIEDGGSQLKPHLEPIVETIVKAFSSYQARNLMFLYDTVGTMGQVFGESLVQTPCCEYLLQSVLQRLGSTETHAPQYLALMDCISYLVQSWQQLYARYAEVTIARAMNAVFEVLYDAKCYEITDGGTEPPRWDIIGCSLDMIATVIGVLQEHSRQLVATVCVTLDPDVIKELKLDKPTGYIPDMINLCCQCADATVLQNVFALLGDVAWQCADLVATETVIASLNLNLLNPSKIVSNNVCWALGVISHTEHGKQRIESVVHEFYPKLVSILVTETESMILQNVCITIGYFAAGYPVYVGANLQQFLEPWLRNISRSSSEHDKANALVSMAQVVLNTAQVPQGALAAITRVILECPPWCKELDITLHALAQRLSLNPVEWNFLQDSEKAKLRERTNIN